MSGCLVSSEQYCIHDVCWKVWLKIMSNESNFEQIKKENRELRKNRDEIHKNYVEVVNENLALHREVERLEALVEHLREIEWMYKDLCD